jgi:hypothetical protein
MRVKEFVIEYKKDRKAPKYSLKPRSPVAHAAQSVISGSGPHKDKKKAEKQGDFKHKKDLVPMEGVFDIFKKKEPATNTNNTDAGPFQPIIDVGSAFSHIKVSYANNNVSLGVKTDNVQESKFALEELKLLRKTIQSVNKDVKTQMSELRQSQADNVANRGAMIPGGGKIGTILRYAVRVSRASERGDISSTLKAVQDSVISPLNEMLLICDKIEIHLKKDIFSNSNKKKESLIPTMRKTTERVRDPEDWDEGNTEPPNNFAVYINGKKWKVFQGRGQYADDQREKAHYQQLKAWAANKSATTGKKWEVAITGEAPTA